MKPSEQKTTFVWALPDTCADAKLLAFAKDSHSTRTLDLRNVDIRKLLYKRFMRLRTKHDAEAWKRDIGNCFPRLYNPTDVLKLSRTIQWLVYFFELVRWQEVPFIKKHLVAQRRVDRLTSKLTEQEFLELERRVHEGEHSREDLITYMSIVFAAKKPASGYVIFVPPRHYGLNDQLFYVAGCAAGTGLDEPYVYHMAEYDLEDDTDDLTKYFEDEQLMMQFARHYLHRAITQATASLRINIELDDAGFMQQSLAVSNPLEVVLSELLARVTSSQTPRKCENPKCTTMFIPSRSDQVYCRRPGCRKVVSRQRAKSRAC